jgi:imidazolonepropionase-like amidohydrolase
LISLVEQSVLPSFQIALDGLIRSAELAVELGLPTLVHNSAPSDAAAREAVAIAGPLFIGGHTNHGTYTAEESVANARWIRDHGGHIEIDTFDAWGRKELHATPEHLIALIQEDLVDIIATDYAAGHWDGIWEMVAGIVQIGLLPIEKAVALATGNVAKALPRIGSDRGLLKAGMAADIVVASSRSLADIALVLVDGRTAYSTAPDQPMSV